MKFIYVLSEKHACSLKNNNLKKPALVKYMMRHIIGPQCQMAKLCYWWTNFHNFVSLLNS